MKQIAIYGMLCLMVLVSACNRKTNKVTTNGKKIDEKAARFTTKSGEMMAYPAVKNYPDIKPKGDGRMLSSKELADKICYCSYEVTRMNEDIKRYHRNNDRNSLLRVKSKAREAQAKFDKCMAKLKADYPMAIMENIADDVMEQVKQRCPGLVELMDAGHKNIIREERTNK